LRQTPAGWRVRSKRAGAHVLRIAFPPGRRKKGSGEVIEVLHPKANPSCEEGTCEVAKLETNPSELLIFGNPSSIKRRMPRSTRRNAGTANHKAHCACFACKYKRGENPRRKVKGKKLHTHRARRNSSSRRRRNQGEVSETEQAVQLFETFHGRESEEIVRKQASAAQRLDYTALGPLLSIGQDDCGYSEEALANKWESCPRIDFPSDGVMLASAPDGKTLYAIGGNQDISRCRGTLEVADPSKDLLDLGEIYFVVYDARKIHNNFEPTMWCHKFGKQRPRLIFNQVQKRIYFVGGEYFIDTKDAVSPGIEG
jgi:hypothetical protein